MSAGIYVHVPFCLTRCGYCDFNAYAGLDHLAPSYVDALVAEAELHAADWSAETIDTIYLVGGTPTTLPVAAIARLLGRLRSAFDVASGAEVTIEANPDTLDPAKLEGLLRDNAFCDAAKACSEGKKSTANLDRLFTSTERDRKKENEAHTERGPR